MAEYINEILSSYEEFKKSINEAKITFPMPGLNEEMLKNGISPGMICTFAPKYLPIGFPRSRLLLQLELEKLSRKDK